MCMTYEQLNKERMKKEKKLYDFLMDNKAELETLVALLKEGRIRC